MTDIALDELYINPWALPPVPADYDSRHESFALTAKQVNRLLNLFLACSTVFLCLVFPVLLYHSLSGSVTLFGLRFVAVTGDAMEPAIRAGALVLARESPFDRLKEGDVIVFAQPDGSLGTRRVAALRPGSVITKGDRAILPDAAPVTREMYRCRVVKVLNFFSPITRALIE